MDCLSAAAHSGSCLVFRHLWDGVVHRGVGLAQRDLGEIHASAVRNAIDNSDLNMMRMLLEDLEFPCSRGHAGHAVFLGDLEMVRYLCRVRGTNLFTEDALLNAIVGGWNLIVRPLVEEVGLVAGTAEHVRLALHHRGLLLNPSKDAARQDIVGFLQSKGPPV